MADHVVTITYNNQTGKVTVPSEAVDVNESQANIEFDLRCSPALPSNHSAKVKGIEFGKPGEPTGAFAPANVFGNEQTVQMNGASHTIYGMPKPGAPASLILVDNNNATAQSGPQEYGYKVWVEVDAGTGSAKHVEGYHPSDDPKIKNTQPPG